MRLFKHKLSGNYYRLVKLNKNNVNTFLEVDNNNKVIFKKRNWSVKKESQQVVLIGFDKLIEL